MNHYIILVFLVLTFGCNSESSNLDVVRPQDPWVFSSQLDGKPDVITIALHEDLWVAYHTTNASLYKAWKGGANFDSAVSTTLYGSQPSSIGIGYCENSIDNPWLVEIGGAAVRQRIEFKEYQLVDGEVIIKYDIILPDHEDVIHVQEKPEAFFSESGNIGLERIFTFSNVPRDTDFFFGFNLSSIASRSSIESNGDILFTRQVDQSVGEIETVDLAGTLRMTPGEPTYLRTLFTEPTLINENEIVDAEGEENQDLHNRLISQNGCENCNNTLSETEKAEGWVLLFDGNSLEGWHSYGKEKAGTSWVIDQESIHLKAEPKGDNGWQVKDGGDIVFEDIYGNFELKLDWRIGPCGNSGIIYKVIESEKYKFPWMTGPEMQLLDNTCHPDAAIVTHRAGDLYDIQESSSETVKPAGEWNSARVRIVDEKLEHWLNGTKVVERTMWDEAWYENLANSKWKHHPDFGESREGKIALQDHRDPVWFRNIKIRRLDGAQ